MEETPAAAGLSRVITKEGKEVYAAIETAEKKGYYELSAAQQRLYIIQKMEEKSTGYNRPMALILEGNIDKDRLEKTFTQLIQRHESLRTKFMLLQDKLVQRIDDEVNSRVEYIEAGREGCEMEILMQDFVKPFDLSRAPLLRVRLIKTGESSSILMVDVHHIISDGLSQQILNKEFIALYLERELPPLRLQYKDYARWQNKEWVKEIISKQEQYWLKELEGEIPVLNLPTDYSRPVVQSFEGSTLNFEINEKETRALNEMARREGVTLFMLLLSLYHIFLSKLTNQEDIVVGTPTAGRRHADLQSIIGMFVNTLALRNRTFGEERFTDFLSEVKEKTLQAFENQEYQFEDLVEKAAAERDLSRNPLFDVMFILQNIFDPSGNTAEIEMEGMKLKPFPYEDNTAKFDFSLTAVEVDEQLYCSLEYCTKLFKRETMVRFINYFKNIMSLAVENPGIKISDMGLITEEEKQQLFYEFNLTEAAYPAEKTLQQLFAEQVERTPDNIALAGGGHGVDEYPTGHPMTGKQQLTYRELSKESGQLAHLLRSKGIKPGTIVGIMMYRSLEMMVGILGILKAGGAYLPIDPGYPRERIVYIMADSAAAVLLAAPGTRVKDEVEEKQGQPQGPPLQFINIKTALATTFEATALTSISASRVSFANLAYIIYTSGSTGLPKGVMVEHTAVVNVLFALDKEYPFLESDVYLLKTSYVFDVSTAELFGWFARGGRLSILEKEGEKDPVKILDIIENSGVTHINFVPSMFNTFLEVLTPQNINKLSTLKYIFLAGEVLLPELVKKFRRSGHPVVLENLYGPTEGTVYSSKYSLQHWIEGNNIPIGKPLDNIRLYIVDAHNKLQGVGIVGELVIAGTGLARGYLNRPELTAEKFGETVISHWSSVKTNDRLYRTGDLACWLADGNIEFFGRIDHQVKIRGFRVELGEVENQLVSHERIKEAVILLKKDHIGDKYLCAYIVPTHAGLMDALKPKELRNYLSGKLPGYMIPSYFVILEEIPLTTSGKIDRKALPTPIVKVDETFAAPGDETQEKLAAIWSNLMGIKKEKISIDANFFELGGHSMKMVLMMLKIHQTFNSDIPMTEMFKNPTIRGIASLIDALDWTDNPRINTNQEREEMLL
jgi:amino acid adenylation domain-containing protein